MYWGLHLKTEQEGKERKKSSGKATLRKEAGVESRSHGVSRVSALAPGEPWQAQVLWSRSVEFSSSISPGKGLSL